MNDSQAYVHSLRGYDHGSEMHKIAQNVRRGVSPGKRDPFTEGQMSIRSPKARNQINMLKTHQRMQSDRLAMPRRENTSINDLERFVRSPSRDSNESPRGAFLRKTMQDSGFKMRKSPSLAHNESVKMSAACLANKLTASCEDTASPTELKSRNGAKTLTMGSLRNMLAAHKGKDLASPRLRYKGAVLD